VLVAAGVGYVWNAITLRWAGPGTAGEAIAAEAATGDMVGATP
jgi:hypothetical protein